jgi:hypothetical protein
MAMDDPIPIREALARYYTMHNLPPDGGASRAFFVVRLGRLRIPLPNPGIRKCAVLYHDLHHLATGYNTVFSDGEVIIAGHELGAGCGRFVIAWVINLWALAVGMFIRPREIFSAFVRGRRCESLYRHPDKVDQFMDMTVAELRHWLRLDHAPPRAAPSDRVSFAIWAIVAWLVTLINAAIIVASIWGVVMVFHWAIDRGN